MAARVRNSRILVVDDDPMVRAWIRRLLDTSEFELAGEASTSAEATRLIERRRADLVLLDQRLPDGLGTELLRRLRASGHRGRVVLMTAVPVPGFNESAREAGADGSILKSDDATTLLEALGAVTAGGTAFDARHPPRPIGQRTLSPRERDALRLAAHGATNREIASALGISSETVKTLISRTLSKLGVSRRGQAVAEAQRLGML